MGKVNRCLKRSFITLNTMSAILGCVLIYGAIQFSAYSHQLSEVGSPSLVWGCLFAIGVLGISCLGIYASCYEEEILLKIFAGFMVFGMIITLIFGIHMFYTKNKIKPSIESITTDEVAKSLKEDEKLRTMVNELQQSLQCCGMVSASDWGDNIPNSCECSGYGGSECKSKPQGVSGPDQIYAQPCSKVMIRLIDLVFNTGMGLYFGLAVIALLGLQVSHLMIRQVEHHDSWGVTSIAMRSQGSPHTLRRPLTPDL